jgi:hypothetical protein
MIEHLIAIVLLALSCLLVYFLLKEIKKQQKIKAKYKLDNDLNIQILKMLGGDKQAALRLLKYVRKNHPGKSYIWYQEKVIRDLQRDRRY